MSLSRYQINPNEVNFHLQKSLEIFDKIKLTNLFNKDKGVESALPHAN